VLHKDLKLLFVGPYPPPHGGISVHVSSACSLLRRHGVTCSVLNTEPRAPHSDAYIKISGAASFARELRNHARQNWTMHAHINGHNRKSWLIALASGAMAKTGLLTIHSGLASNYLRDGSRQRRAMVRLACSRFKHVVCVNTEIAEQINRLGIPCNSIHIIPAFLPPQPRAVCIPEPLEQWLSEHEPILSTALFFRPEYGFEVLMRALSELRKRLPHVGCVVMGGGEERAGAENLIDREGLRGNVWLVGDVDHDLCLRLIARSSVFVRPTYKDGDSISVREAVALGVPVVASNVGARPREALLFQPGDSEDLRSRIDVALGHAGDQRLSNVYSESVNRLLKLYSLAS
jgi:glycosyltransferase involved in cell wall biosynthesis